MAKRFKAGDVYKFEEPVYCELCGERLRTVEHEVILDEDAHIPKDWKATIEQHGDLANCIKHLRSELSSVRSSLYTSDR
jgi:hypothetical protein